MDQQHGVVKFMRIMKPDGMEFDLRLTLKSCVTFCKLHNLASLGFGFGFKEMLISISQGFHEN